MKTTNVIERLSLFLLALVLTMPTWAQGSSGNESETITIASKEDWKTFCNRVNSGQTTLNAKLTKDVDLGEEIVMAGTADPSYYNFFYYTGTFDGQGHTLKFNWNAGKDDRIAPFKYVKDATIKNLRTQGKITSKGESLSGMVYAALGTTTLTGCISDVDITGGDGGWYASRASGMVQAVGYQASVHITDCLVKGSITDNADESERAMAGFVFFNNGTYTLTRCLYVGTNNAPNYAPNYTFGTESGISYTFTDCYYLNTCGKAQGEQVTAERLKSGEMAKLLQGDRTENVWGQTLGTDLEPLPTADATKRVYEVKFVYNGEVKATRYATNGQSIHGGLPTAQALLGTGYNPHHYYAIAFEGGFNASTPVNADRKVDITLAEKDCYEIASKDNWKEFRDIVGNGQNAVDAKMTADVNLGSDIFMVGNSYAGTFDGQGHTLKINWNGGSDSDIAPFYTVKNATIKNLRTEGEIKSSTHFLSGLICNAYGTVTISGCVSNVNITSSYDKGGCNAAGMIECVRDNAKVTITDCLVKGKFTATTKNGKTYMGGFVCNQYGTCTLTNCLYASENNATGGYTFASTYFSGTTLNNCYYLNPCGKTQGEPATKAQLESGEVAYKLQGDRTDSCHWAQVLGEWPGFYREADKAKPNYVYYNKENNEWVCDDFRLTDDKPLPIGIDFTATKATYERTLSSKHTGTLCLPYDLPVQGFNAYTLSENQGNTDAVRFTPVTDRLEAYKPYLLMANGTLQLGGENIQVKAYNADALTTPASKYKFVGTVNGVDNASAAAANAYILQSDGIFHKVTADNPSATIPAYRAYIQRNGNGAKQLSVIIDDETTGIGDVPDGTTDSAVYDLQGRRMADQLDDNARRWLPAGVYIVNGRKVILK